jgi:iron complex transport system substrate-binding protein
MRWLAILLLATGCAEAPRPRASARPVRIVSLDYCADQYALKLAGRHRIVALSPHAERPESYMRGAARGIPKVVPRAEEVLALEPDLVIRSYGGGPGAAALFARAGVPVLQLGYAEDIAGVRAGVIDVARGLGEPARGQAVAAEMDRRLAALRRAGDGRELLYMTSGGVTTGPGSLIDALIRASGHRNFQRAPGWHPLPLERLAYQRPNLIAAAFYGREALLDRWSAARHPVAAAQLRDRPVVALESAWTACGGWFLLDAVEAMARAGRGA